MQDPYELLGLGREASEAEIRARYLALVREFPPDRAPERFAEIRAAFEKLRDPLANLDRQLFFLNTDDSLLVLKRDIRRKLLTAKIPVDLILSLADAR
jgi:curved DNA-binding protein CbpA